MSSSYCHIVVYRLPVTMRTSYFFLDYGYGIPLGPLWLHIEIQRAIVRWYDGDNAIVRWQQCDNTMATMRQYDGDNATTRKYDDDNATVRQYDGDSAIV
ncbi:hypothetical protein DPMN_152950 [Dreissena polymorpha]|uniref:Uncharacterized protein n=1 Tax=Dreissena polymorpha TaxID=45954 RepID=A0A9D4FI85_DREPO|nr:hypothetical protein DPMN_152950 [Dreissena polymorpha]